MKTDWDQRLAKTARAMIAAAAEGRDAEAVMKRACRGVYRQIRRVRQQRSLLPLWGTSRNSDENAGGQIVHPAVLEVIGRVAGVEMSGDAVHAGLQHTYGYLFSLIETPYGFKRQRWIETGLERGLGLDASVFSPAPRQGDLLANLTYCLGRIAFRGRRRELARLRRCASLAAASLRQVDYRRLRRRRVREVVSLGRSTHPRSVSIVSDLVSLPHATAGGPGTWLVYSIVDSTQPIGQLITAFTVDENTVEEILSQEMGRCVAIRPRYNLYLEGAMNRDLRGRRDVV